MNTCVEFHSMSGAWWGITPQWNSVRPPRRLVGLFAKQASGFRTSLAWYWGHGDNEWILRGSSYELLGVPSDVAERMKQLRPQFEERARVEEIDREAREQSKRAAREAAELAEARHRDELARQEELKARDAAELVEAQRWARIARLVIEMLQAEP